MHRKACTTPIETALSRFYVQANSRVRRFLYRAVGPGVNPPGSLELGWG